MISISYNTVQGCSHLSLALKVANIMISISYITVQGCSHLSLALKVANEILSDPQAFGTRVLCKVLTSLDLTGCDQSSIKDLKVLAYKLFEVRKGLLKTLI
jgi:hypothetical protein